MDIHTLTCYGFSIPRYEKLDCRLVISQSVMLLTSPQRVTLLLGDYKKWRVDFEDETRDDPAKESEQRKND